MSNYKDWIKTIDIDIDYFSAFVKAWIAFNSWYRTTYPTMKTDSSIIDKIKMDSNDFKSSIINLLLAQDSAGTNFRENIGKLHIALCNATVMTQERSNDRVQISFSSIAVTNPNNKVSNQRVRFNEFYMERTHFKIIIKIKNTSSGVYIFEEEQGGFDVDALSIHPKYVALSAECQRKGIEIYRSIAPYIKESILTTSTPCWEFSSVKFVKDENKVSRGIIDVLYLLRCSLMHGDVSPNNTAMKVYKYSYEILSAVLKKLL